MAKGWWSSLHLVQKTTLYGDMSELADETVSKTVAEKREDSSSSIPTKQRQQQRLPLSNVWRQNIADSRFPATERVYKYRTATNHWQLL